jgi:type IV pilus assembly protein PilW
VELSFSLSPDSELICTINGASPVEVVIADNIVNIQIVYGEDVSGNGTVNKYIDASSVSNWNKVISVKIGLVVSSDLNNNENLADKVLSFPDLSVNPMNVMFDIDADGHPDLFESVAGSGFDTQTAPDNRLYKVYTATIALRNRVL